MNDIKEDILIVILCMCGMIGSAITFVNYLETNHKTLMFISFGFLLLSTALVTLWSKVLATDLDKAEVKKK